MDILLVYDVSVTTLAGQRRLRRVAKTCQAYGTRVQQSVFELVLAPADLPRLEAALNGIIDPDLDSVRLYRLATATPVKAMGVTRALHSTKGPLIL